MLKKALFVTETHEITLEQCSSDKWELLIYDIRYGIRNLEDKQILDHKTTGLMYIKSNYLKDLPLEVF